MWRCGIKQCFFPRFFFFFFNFNYSPLLQKLTCNIQVIREFYKTIVCLTGKQLQSTWLVEKHYKREKMHVWISCRVFISFICLDLFHRPNHGATSACGRGGKQGERVWDFLRAVLVILAPTVTALLRSLLQDNTTQSFPTTHVLYCRTVRNEHQFIWKLINTNKTVSQT